jgi:hypothetical protein
MIVAREIGGVNDISAHWLEPYARIAAQLHPILMGKAGLYEQSHPQPLGVVTFLFCTV